jgi:serine/threonine-protein kinase RIO1
LVANLVRQLIKANISHGDMKATNIIVTSHGLKLIDLDAMQIHASHTKTVTAINADISRLLRNWDDSSIKLSYSSALQIAIGDDYTLTL